MEAPFISILIPTYNRADLLLQTLSSVLEQGDELQHTEIIVSDDGSKDSTRALLESFRQKHPQLQLKTFHHEKNLGGPGNWAFLLSEARGEYTYLLSDDDWIAPDFLKSYRAILLEHPDVDLVYSGFEYRDDSGKTLEVSNLSSVAGKVSGPERLKNQLLANHMVMSSMYRTSALRAAGGWQARFGMHLDSAAFSLVAIRSSWTYFIDRPLFYFRLGQQSWSTFKVEKQKQHYLAYRSVLEELRQLAPQYAPELIEFLNSTDRIRVRDILNNLHIKAVHGNLSRKQGLQLLRDLSSVYPVAWLSFSFYKMLGVSVFGAGGLEWVRQKLGKAPLKNSSVFERSTEKGV